MHVDVNVYATTTVLPFEVSAVTIVSTNVLDTVYTESIDRCISKCVIMTVVLVIIYIPKSSTCRIVLFDILT